MLRALQRRTELLAAPNVVAHRVQPARWDAWFEAWVRGATRGTQSGPHAPWG